jgi:hypothetical protein
MVLLAYQVQNKNLVAYLSLYIASLTSFRYLQDLLLPSVTIYTILLS